MENKSKMIDLYDLGEAEDSTETETSELASEYLTKVKRSFDSQAFQNFEGLVGLARREAVNHPEHYNQGVFEVIDVIEDWKLDFNAGNVVKYLARHTHGGKPLEDLKKARWYLNRIIKGLENGCD